MTRRRRRSSLRVRIVRRRRSRLPRVSALRISGHRMRVPGRRRPKYIGRFRAVAKVRGRRRVFRGRWQSNPNLRGEIALPMGLSLPSIESMGFGVLGMLVPNMITAKVMPYLPAGYNTPTVGLAVKAVAGVAVPGMLIRKYVSRDAGTAYMIVGAASVALDLIKTYAPSVLTTFGLSGQPLLGQYMGAYFQRQAGGQVVAYPAPRLARTDPAMIGEVPDRLQPGSRF